MTTDRAFIAALQQTAATWPGADTPTTTPAPGASDGEGPHFVPTKPARKKAPLSEHLARRRDSRHAPTDSVPPHHTPALRPGVEVPAFQWPEAAARLGAVARQPLIDLLLATTKDAVGANAPTIAFVGTGTGVGTTTALLAAAMLIESAGGRVAILDTSRAGGAASLLGVRRSSHPSGRIDHTLIDDLLVTNREKRTSVLAAGPSPDAGFAAVALGRLSQTHDLVLIDADDAPNASLWLGQLAAMSPAVLLFDTADGEPSQRRQAHQALQATGIAPRGLVETLADGC